MSIQEKVMAPGTFTVSLSATLTPNSIINGIDPWGQILIHSTRVDENTLSNEDMIKNARYVGVVQNLEYDLDSFQVSGKGTMVYMGDTDSRGLVVAETSTSGSVRSYTNASLSDVLDRSTSQPFGLLRTGDTAAQQAVRTKTGSITNPTSGTTTYTGDHYLESVYKAVKFVCEHFDCEFFVDNQGFLFAGRPEDLFSGHDSDPTAIIIRQGQGEDPNIEGFIPAGITTGFNAEEFISKVELIPTQASKQVSMATATESSNPYKDLFNNSLKRIQVVKDASATQSNFQARANKALNEYNRLKKTVNVSLQGYDISGSFTVGDKIFIYDPEVGFEDDATKAADESRSIHQVTYQGSTINPEKIRVVGMSYPVQSGMGVYYRNGANGNILDLTDYVEFETGDISLEIGDVGGSLSSDFSTAAAIIATGTNDEFTIPDQPTKPSNGNAGFDHTTGSYRDGAGQVHGFIKLNWTTPQNKNGTTITDGSHFEIQWRMVSDRDGNNIIDSADAALGTNDYMVANVGFDQNTFVIENLNIGFTYTVRLIAFDVNGHSSDAVSVAAIQIPRSSIAPNKPATPSGTLGSLAAGLLRAQIVHNLAQVKDSDGNVISSPVNFTLDRDLSHLNVYGATSTFNLSYDSTNKKVSDSDRSTYYLGMIPCNNGNIDLNVAAVGTINLDSLNLTGNDTVHFRISAVNISGRESEPSDSFNTSGANTLVDTQHIKTAAITTALIGTAQVTNAEIRDLNVNKLVSGSISGKTITLATDSGTNSTIESSNFSSGSTGFQIKSNGDVEFNDGNFRGDITGASGTFSGALSGATGTFSGSLSAATGTFSGNLSAAGGTFTGDISANQVTADTLNLNRIPSGIQAKIDANSLDATKIANNAIEQAKIAAGAVVEAKLANASVTSSKITNSSSRGTFGTSGNELFCDFIGANSATLSNRLSTDSTGVTITGIVTIAPTSGSIGNGNTSGSFSSVSSPSIANGSTAINLSSSGDMQFNRAGSQKFKIINFENQTSDDIRPSTDNSFDLGQSNRRFDDVFATNGTIQTSDITLKENIETTDLGLDFVNDLTPIEFTWKDGGVRTHLGFSAQDIKEKLITHKGADQNMAVYTQGSYETYYEKENEDEFGGFDLVEVEEHDFERFGLRHNELIPVLTKAIQELSTQVSDLTARIETLEG